MSNDPPELAALIPGLTRSTITDDERAALYHAAMSGHQLPLRCRRWKASGDWLDPTSDSGPRYVIETLQCPGCGHQTKPAETGPLACDGCGNVYLVPDA